MVKLIWWRKVNDQDVKVPVEKVMKYRNGTRIIPSLTILDVKDDDKGVYWCEAINSIGPSFSESVEVNLEAGKYISLFYKALVVGHKSWYFS